MRKPLLYGALAVLYAIAVAGCDEKLSDLTGPTPNLEPTFRSIQQNIFEAGDPSGRVPCTQCHNAIGSLFNGLNLTNAVAYSNLVNRSSVERPGILRVAPGDPDASYLIHKVEGRAGIVGGRMPFNGPFLSGGQILVIKRWIELGANND
ncbi:MAG TPA: hypothetical protein VFB85_13380 [Vicinamibacterales bacterium]|nr:hypothetical protein [Vicinamibacterales bacterium]